MILGIESSAHTFGVGISHNKKILANEKKVFTTKKGGIRPVLAAEHHKKNAEKVIISAIKKAGVKPTNLKGIAFTIGPGLGPCLQVGAISARILSLKLGIPLIAVNHCIAHIEIGLATTKAKNPVILYVSGGNTQIIYYSNKKYRVYGETLDMGLGNLLDTFGRSIGMGFPAGPKIDQICNKKQEYIKLPYTIKGTDMAFSGLLTSAKNALKKSETESVAYSLMTNACCMITEATERTMANLDTNELLLVGGVGASNTLKKILSKMCKQRKAKLFYPENKYQSDNGAMIALTGELMLKAGQTINTKNSAVKQRYRTDQAVIKWK